MRLVLQALKNAGEGVYGEVDKHQVKFALVYEDHEWLTGMKEPNISPEQFLATKGGIPKNPGPIPMPEVKPPKDEAVIHPQHYGGDTVYEVIKVITAWVLGFCFGNALKYIARAGKKDPTKEIEDLEKAKNYIEMYLEILKGK